MPNTINIGISNVRWTSVIFNGTGFFTNESDNIIIYKTSNEAPEDSDQSGHTLQRRSKKPYSISLGSIIWMRSVYPENAVDKNAVISITPNEINENISALQDGAIIHLLRAILMGIEIIADQEEGTLIENVDGE